MAQQNDQKVTEKDTVANTESTTGITARSLLIGIVGVALTCVLVTWAELILSSIRIGYLQLPPVSIAILLLVLAGSRFLTSLLRGRFRLRSTEIVTVYVMSLVAAMVSSHGLVQRWLPLLVTPNYAASQGNNWAQLYFPQIRRWMVPWNPSGPPKQPLPTGYYEGLRHGMSIPWSPWIVPLCVWGLFLALIIFAFICLTSILRRQWVENERLSFPLAQLPIEILGDCDTGRCSFFRSPLVWGGVAIPVAIYLIDWIHQFSPSVPLIPTGLTLNDFLVNSRYQSIDYTPLIYSYAAVGFFYLLPSDILFSIWFFFVLSRLQEMLAISLNMDLPGMPLYPVKMFVGYQTVGAYMVLGFYFFWIARPHLKRFWAIVQGKEKARPDELEMLPHRVAFYGLFASLIGGCVILYVMGMSPWLAALELLGFVFIIALVMARSTAEAGMLMTETTLRPIDLYRVFGSVHNLGAANLTVLAFVDNLLMRDQRGLLLTGMMDSSWLFDKAKINRRGLFWTITVGILAALAVAVPLQLYLPYRYGGLQMDSWMMVWSPQVTFSDYAPFFHGGATPMLGAWQMPMFLVVGIIVTALLLALRSQFYWWPLHPLGYALAGSWSTIQFWFPCLVAWILKSLTIRYGGNAAYRRFRPFFLGLIIGEFGMAVLSASIGIVLYWISGGHMRLPPPAFPWQ